jgi:exodeoxyribonuclease VII large subunit
MTTGSLDITAILEAGTLTVAGLTAYIQALVEDNEHLHQIWVLGEVSSVNHHRSGVFFTLQDPEEKAAINAVIWSSYAERVANLPVVGEQVIVLGKVKVMPARGQYQLAVWQCLPAGEGLLSLRYRQLKQRLEAEGLFDAAHKRPLPPHPRTLAVVTSPQAAAWGDIQKTLRSRYPGIRVLLSAAIVQGEQAPASIAAAIERVNADGRAEVMIVSRGGGATEDLACFNDERVVRAIALSEIPVIAGIGHQRDESLADLAADWCAHTPTAAAQWAVPDLQALIEGHGDRALTLADATRQYLLGQQTHLDRLRSRLAQLHPAQQLAQEQRQLTWLKQALLQNLHLRLQPQQQTLVHLQQKLVALDPTAVLQRGYAVVWHQGEVVRSSESVAVGQALEIHLGQGRLQVEVTAVESPPHPPP